MKVADQLQKVSIPVTKNRFVPALEEVADAPVTAVIVLGVRRLNTLEDFRERRLAGFEQEMDVVGQQDVGVDSKLIALPLVFDSLQVARPVPIVAKDRLALIATHQCPLTPSMPPFQCWL